MPPTEYAPEWLELENQMGGRSTLHGDANGLREMFNGLMAALAPSMPPPDSTISHTDSSANGVPVRIHKPKDASSKLPLGVFFHSGGYVVGNLDSEGAFCDFLAHHGAGSGCVVVNVDYRLAPEAKSPAQFDDCMTAWKWAVANVDSLGGDKDRMFTAGGSAGGCLSLAVTSAIVGDASTRNQVKGCMALVPATVHESNVPGEWQSIHTSYVDNEEAPVIDRKSMRQFYEIAGVDPQNPDNFPALATNAHAHFPPTYIAACEGDPLRDDAMVMNEILKKAGVKTQLNLYKGLPHYFWIMPGVPQAERFMGDVLGGVQFILS